MTTILETKRLILKQPEGSQLTRPVDIDCDIVENSSGETIGQAGLFYLPIENAQPEIEIRFQLKSPYQHQGYAIEIGKALVKWAFNELNVEKVVALIEPKNESARAVLEKINMQYWARFEYQQKELAKYECYRNLIQLNEIQMELATINEFPIMQNLADFYAYDISEFYTHDAGWEQAQNGRFEIGMNYLRYWQEKDTYPHLLRYRGELMGFVIVNKQGSSPDVDIKMEQFFILRKFKGKGIGKYIARRCFEQFKGVWEILIMPHNEGAYRFWRKIVREYTNENYEEYSKLLHNTWTRNFFKFKSQ